MVSLDSILLLPILLPIVGAVLVFLTRTSSRLQSGVVVGTVLSTFAATVAIYAYNPDHELQLIFFQLVDYGLSFRPTHLGALFAMLSAGLWAVVTVFSLSYMRERSSPTRFASFLLSSLSGCIGVFLAGDYFTLFLFFEIMTFAAYPLVIHDEDAASMRAGDNYLYTGVAGGLVLLLGIVMLVWATGTADIVPVLYRMQPGTVNPYVLAGIFVVGFGVKVGLVPLHVWIPYAYPAAPAPATALMSGIMGKTGFFGIISVLTVTFAPTGNFSGPPVAKDVGYVLIWLALLTIVSGAVMALRQSHVKRLLAYSSISQMGYVMLAVGCAAYLGAKGGLPYTAAVFHAFNHAIFKSGLFLMMGSVYLRAQSMEFAKLGGMAKLLPLTAFGAAVSMAAVVGVPGLSGFGSKKLVQYALEKAADYNGTVLLAIAVVIFSLASAFTAAYMIKLFHGVFLGEYRGEARARSAESVVLPAILLLFAVGIVVIGVLPERMIAVLSATATATSIDMAVMSEQLMGVKLWTMNSYMAVALPLALGLILFLGMRRFRFDSWPTPRWLSVEGVVYRPIYMGFLDLCCRYVTKVEGGICDLYDRSGSVSNLVLNRVRRLDEALDEGYEVAERTTSRVVEQARGLDKGIDDVYTQIGHQVSAVTGGAAEIEGAITAGYVSVGQAVVGATGRLRNESGSESLQSGDRPEAWNPQNITLASLVVAGVMVAVLLVLYVVGLRALR